MNEHAFATGARRNKAKASLVLPLRNSSSHEFPQNGRIPATDIFSFTIPDHIWIVQQWLTDSLMWLLYQRAGLAGLIGAAGLTTLCLFIMAQGWLPRLVSRPIFVWGIFLFLAFFSIVEIPLMIYAIRRLAVGANPRARYIALLTNTGYVFFAAVYAAPFILLTSEVWLGAALATLSLVRLIAAIIYLPQ